MRHDASGRPAIRIGERPAPACQHGQAFRVSPRQAVWKLRATESATAARRLSANRCTARSSIAADMPRRCSQRRPAASCRRSFRAGPTGNLLARRSASAACSSRRDLWCVINLSLSPPPRPHPPDRRRHPLPRRTLRKHDVRPIRAAKSEQCYCPKGSQAVSKADLFRRCARVDTDQP